MRLKAQIHDFRLKENALESYRNGGIKEHSIYRHVSKGGASLLPGQSANTSVYISAIPTSNYGGNNVIDVIGKDILPSALTKLADNIDNKIAKNIMYTAAKYLPMATTFVSHLYDKRYGRSKPTASSNYTFKPNYTFSSNNQPSSYNDSHAIQNHQKHSIEYHPRNAIEHQQTKAIEYKGSGNKRAQQAYKSFLNEKKNASKSSHKGGGFNYS